jgi:hypothetical protein
MRAWLGLPILLLAFAATTTIAMAQTKPASPTTRPVKGTNAPAPDQLMNSMLKPQGDPRAPLQPLPDPPKVDPATGKIIPPNPPTPVLKREGSFVIDRPGRIQKAADGNGFEFVFDSDGQNMDEPPVGLLPNQKLESMELAIQGLDHDPKFRVTGMVTEYKGRNYLLLEKATIVPDALKQF